MALCSLRILQAPNLPHHSSRGCANLGCYSIAEKRHFLPEEVSDWIEEDYNGYFAYRTLMSFLLDDYDLIGTGDSLK